MINSKNQIFNFEPFKSVSDANKNILSEKVELINFDIGEQLIDENVIPGRVLIISNGSARSLIKKSS